MPNDPLWINASAGAPAYDARELRRAMAMLLTQGVTDRFGARSGVHPAGSDAVTLSGTTWTVQHTKCVVYPGLNSLAGPYIVQLVSESGSLDPADATNPRKDIIVARVYDNDEDSLGLRQAVPEYIAGVPGPTPSEPAVPAGSFRMASIDVPADPGTPTIDYNAPFTVASGGILPVRDATEIPVSGLYDGAAFWQQDTKQLKVWDGSAAVVVAESATSWTTYAPVITGHGSATFSTLTGYWRRVAPETVFFVAYFAVSAAGSGTGNVTITAPTNIARVTRQMVSGHIENGVASPVLRAATAVAFDGGTGATFDRIRFDNGGSTNGLTNLTGGAMGSGMLCVIEGTYREAP